MASASAGTSLTLGVLAVLVAALAGGWEGWFVATGLLAVGAVEYCGGRRIRRADPASPRLLALNQLALLAIITAYCLSQMLLFSPETARSTLLSGEFRAQLAALPGMEKSLYGLIDRWAPLVVYGVYGLVILLSAVSQGLLAWYYLSRRKPIARFHAETPPWVRRVFTETQV